MTPRWSPFFRLLPWALILGIGVLAAWPFFTTGLVSSGDGFNYSLSVSDAVHQARAGTFPPLIGQTRYAYNGRIHPLRTAPYLHFLAIGVDSLTARQMSPWEIQNVSLALSLMAAAIACYLSLRWATGCSRPLAVFLSAIYTLSPPLLGSAYTFDLFMTVHAAVFVPIALGGCLRACRVPSLGADAAMAAGLAGAWLAHPPVALWLSVGVALVRGGYQLRWGTWRSFATLVFAVVLFAVLGGYSFVSSMTLGVTGSIATLAKNDEPHLALAADIVRTVGEAFPRAVLPVSAGANRIADYQLGYAGWLLLAGMVAGLVAGRRRGPDWLMPGILALGYVAFLLILDLPIGGVTPFLWVHLPRPFLDLTNMWPMYRLYLVALGFLVFGVARVASAGGVPGRSLARLGWIVGAAALAWTLGEARPFLRRGHLDVTSETQMKREYLPSNLDLTVTSFALINPPEDYTIGVSDPEFVFRVVTPGANLPLTNLSATLSEVPVSATGALVWSSQSQWLLAPGLTLQPGRRYVITFDFAAAPVDGHIVLDGPTLHRVYDLGRSSMPQGFGMAAGHSHSLVVWTDRPDAESITLTVYADGPVALPRAHPFATVSVREVVDRRLPVRLVSLQPLVVDVTPAAAGSALVTPRGWVPDYQATVNGRPVDPVRSADGRVMVPLAPGQSHVELTYVGPPALRIAFWTGCFGWIVFLLLILFPRPLAWTGHWLSSIGTFTRNHPVVVALYAIVAIMVTFSFQRMVRPSGQVAGAARIDVRLPWGNWGKSEPLFASGHTGAGTVVFVTYLDSSHVEIAADVWGIAAFRSKPIACDYTRAHTLIVSDSGLFPLGNRRVAELPAATRDALRAELLVQWDGVPVIEQTVDAYEAAPTELFWGRTAFGPLSLATFQGRILGSERLSVPRVAINPTAAVALNVRFVHDSLGRSEPLLYAKNALAGVTVEAVSLHGNRQRIRVLGEAGSELARGDFVESQRGDHRVQFAMGGPAAYSLRVDDFEVLAAVPPVALPTYFATGLNDGRLAGVAERFSGGHLDLSGPAPGPFVDALALPGPIDLILRFPERPAGQEPLVVTGRTGQGDLVYVVYADPNHLRIGFDHWGVMGYVSPPIAVSYAGLHSLRVSLGSLYPALDQPQEWAGVPANRRAILKETWSVDLDGRRVVTKQAGSHPFGPAELYIGANPIGGSTCDTHFRGAILLAQRAGLTAP